MENKKRLKTIKTTEEKFNITDYLESFSNEIVADNAFIPMAEETASEDNKEKDTDISESNFESSECNSDTFSISVPIEAETHLRPKSLQRIADFFGIYLVKTNDVNENIVRYFIKKPYYDEKLEKWLSKDTLNFKLPNSLISDINDYSLNNLLIKPRFAFQQRTMQEIADFFGCYVTKPQKTVNDLINIDNPILIWGYKPDEYDAQNCHLSGTYINKNQRQNSAVISPLVNKTFMTFDDYEIIEPVSCITEEMEEYERVLLDENSGNDIPKQESLLENKQKKRKQDFKVVISVIMFLAIIIVSVIKCLDLHSELESKKWKIRHQEREINYFFEKHPDLIDEWKAQQNELLPLEYYEVIQEK